MDEAVKNKKVLIVEDELFIRDIYETVLKESGFNVVTAGDGLEAIEKLSLMPDLILLDIMLPKKTGIDVLKEVKASEKTKAIPVVVLSNLGHRDTIDQTFSLGAQGYLVKMNTNANQLGSYVSRFIKDPSYKMDPAKIAIE